MSELTDKLLAKPVGPVIESKAKLEPTRELEVREATAELVVRGPDSPITNEAALIDAGLSPDDWRVSAFKTSEWTMSNGEQGIARRFTFERMPSVAERHNIDELVQSLDDYRPRYVPNIGSNGFIVALGDMQFGKIDGDGVEGTLRRTVEGLYKARHLLGQYHERFDIGHVHIAWLGDHVEGFNSQGGANTWRTVLTMSEQIRLTRRVMLEALKLFADQAEHVSMAAIPGNHGEPQRIAGKGMTRYDDSHDTESLIAVMDAAHLYPEQFGHVQFYVPETDEMTVTIPIAGTNVAHVHGNQFRPGKHFEWWKGQAFAPESPLASADLLLAGHLHHEMIESDGKRLFIQVPSMESESTWFRHNKGTTGNPGLIVAITKDGVTSPLEFVR